MTNFNIIMLSFAEYCQQIFKPTCSDLEIVIMGSAEYGRMHIGKCMEKDYGLPSCYNDELQFFDKLCSGKSQCELEIPKYDLTSKLQCLDELSPYLEASYSCQKGIKIFIIILDFFIDCI